MPANEQAIGPGDQDWYGRTLRRIFLDMHLPDWTRAGQSGGTEDQLKGVATHFDVDELVSTFVRARVNLVVFYAKCQYGNFYYDTQLGHKHNGLGSLNLLGEFIPRAHVRGIKVIGYYSNGWDVEVARAHPDWMMQDEKGNSSYERWPRICFNSPYRDVVHRHLKEMFSNYRLDGLWMDMLHVLPCYCPRCEALYRNEFGKTMPRRKTDQGWVEMVRWQQRYLDEYIRQARDLVKNLRPDAAFTINFYGSPYAEPSTGLSTQHLRRCDYGSTEGYTEWHGLLFPSYSARYMRAAARGKHSEVLISRFLRTWDFTMRPTAQIKFEAFSAAANGAAVCLDDEPYHDGRIEPLVYDALEQVYSEIEDREPYLFDAVPIYYAGVYHSMKTREIAEMLAQVQPTGGSDDFYGFDLDHLGAPSDPVLSTQGTFKALIEGHLPFEFLYEEGLTAEELDRFRVVYLPNVISMSEHDADLLRSYVANGGTLVATGATSLYDEWGRQRSNFLLADLFGVDYVRHSPFSFAFLQASEGAVDLGLGTSPVPHYRPLLEVNTNRPAEVAATLVEPLIETMGELYYHNNKPSPYRDTGIPAVVLSQYGEGRVVYMSGEPEANYAVLGDPAHRRLIMGALTWAAREPFEIVPHVPLNTEVVYRTQDDRTLLHFVTGWPQKRVSFHSHGTSDVIEETFVVKDVRVDLPFATHSAQLVPGGQMLEIQRADGRAWVILPGIELWETLVLQR